MLRQLDIVPCNITNRLPMSDVPVDIPTRRLPVSSYRPGKAARSSASNGAIGRIAPP